MNRLKKSVLDFLFGLCLVCVLWTEASVMASPPTPPPNPPSPRRVVEPDQRETMILSLRSADGYRVVELLRLFVPREYRDTEIRYNHTLNKILVRAHPDLLQRLRAASKQLDAPLSQFGVRLFFVKTLSKGEVVEEHVPTGMLTSLSQTFPTVSGFSLVEQLYLHASNHEEAKAKITNLTNISDPFVSIRLHQTPHPQAAVLVEFQISQNEMFSSVGPKGADTKFVSSVHLRTRLFVKPGRFVVIGHAPLQRIGKAREKVLVVMHLRRLPDVLDTENDDAPKAIALGSPQQIAQDPPSNRANEAQPPTAPTSQPAAPLSPKTTAIASHWGRHSIVQVIRKNVAHFKRCYEQALKSRPGLEGRVVMSFAIQAAGDVAEARVKSTTLQAPEVEACLLRHFQALRFPAPPQGKPVRVTYPLKFAHK